MKPLTCPRLRFASAARAGRRNRGSHLALLGICLLALHLLATPVASAQAQPPNRFYGKASVDGKDQGEGTVVEAYAGNTLCGSGTVQNRNGDTIYVVDVLGAGQKPGCASDGDTIRFRIAGLDAKETGSYQTAAATRLDLTATGTPRQVAQPTVLPPGGGATPAPPPSFTPVASPPGPAPTAAPTPPAATATPASGASPAATAPPVGGIEETPTPPSAAAAPRTTPSAAPAAARPSGTSGGAVSWVWRIVGFLAFAGIVFGAVAWYRRWGAR